MINVRTFLLGALCGAVVFSIVDRLVEERERRLAVREANSPAAAAARSDTQPLELQPATKTEPTPDSEELAAAADAPIDQEAEAVDLSSRDTTQAAAPVRGAASEDVPKANEPEESPSAVDSSSETSAPAAARPDDETWGSFMEQALRQYLASHRTAAQFDIQTIRCAANVCEIRGIGFDQSTEPVWQQVVYDIRQQPWAEIGQAGSTWGLAEGRFVVTAKLVRRPRQ